MPLWGRPDNAANSVLTAVQQFNKSVTTANQALLYANTKAGTLVENAVVGQFAIDTTEAQANPSIPHAGWVLRKEGTGLRAGRVTYEVLVAGGTYGIPDGADDTVIPDYVLRVTTNPTSNTTNTIGNLTFTVAAASTPTGASIKYYWQVNTGAAWANVANTSGQYFNNTSPTFTANNLTANGNVFRVLVTAVGANSVTSTSATVKYVTP